MKPFAVSCTTCRARLKVLDPAAIGQILACPKCHSMVEVVPPLDWTPEDEAEPAAAAEALPAAIASEHPSATTSVIAPPPLAVSRVGPGKTDSAASSAAPAKAVASTAAPAKAVASTAAPAKAAAAIAAPAKAAAAIAAPTAGRIRVSSPPATDAAAEVSRWFWPTFGGATFLAVAVAALVIYWDRHNKASAGAAESAAAPVAQTTASTPAVAPSPPPLASHPTAPKAGPAPVTTVASAPPSQPAESPTAPTPPLAVSRVAPQTAPPVAAPPTAQAPAAPPVAAAAQHVAPAVPPAAHVAAANPAPEPATAPDPPPFVAPPAAPRPIAHPTLQRIPPPNIDLNARLADNVPAIEFNQSPLTQFLSDLSQMSTVPISLDIDALHEMNLSADLPISVELKNTTLAGILDQALTVHGLGWRRVGNQIEVGRPTAQEPRQVRYSVADLAGNSPESRRQFAALVHSLVEPNGWSEAAGSATSVWNEGTLLVTADASAHAQMLMFCEKLRLARGLPLRSRFPRERFHLDSRTAHAKAVLDAPITVNFARPEPLEKILGYLRASTHLNLLVDHIALAGDGMSAESEGMLIAQQQSFGQALAALLEPMELTYRVIDDRTIEITTPKAAARHAEVEFYSAADLPDAGSDGHDLVARIARELNADPAGSPRGGAPSPTIRFDAASRYLIVRAPQAVERRVESLLSTWRVAKQ